MTDTVLSFERVCKHFARKDVLRDISFPLKRGECVALTGMNGSGKTTLLKLAGGLTRPSAGKVSRDSRMKVHYIPEHFPPLAISARSILSSLGRVEGMEKVSLDRTVTGLLESFHLLIDSGKPLASYSKGMLQKVCVIQALLCRADILLLDEPLSGQDAASQETFTRLIKPLLASGTAVLLACHEQHLIDLLADTVFRIHGGTLHTARAPRDPGRNLYLFRTPGAAFVLPEALRGLTATPQGEDLLQVAAPCGAGDGMLRAMLEAGCSLLEMRYE